jgi:DNA repair exonuclease SbcCD ATPase subunit
MADNETKVAETGSPAQDAAVDVKTLQEQLDAVKRAQAGSDKAYSEAEKKRIALESELEKLRKEKMSEKERADFEIAKERAEVEKQKREVADATLRFSKMQILAQKNIALDFADYISGSSEDEISKNADTFVKRFNDAVGKGIDERLAGTAKPKAGNQTAQL